MIDRASETVHYFAFGANMARQVLVHRRGITPHASRAAVVHGFTLRFGLRGIPGVEPAFATLVAMPGASVHGVLHTLSARDLARLDRIESSYDRIDVRAETSDGTFDATAYVARRLSDERMPSRRYLRLLIEGAREHGVPEAYVAALEARASHHLPLVSGVVARVIQLGERAIRSLRRRG